MTETRTDITRRIPVRTAWLRAVAMTLVLWVVLGLGGFTLSARAVYQRWGTTVHAAFILDMAFVALFLVVAGITIWWQRRTGGSLADLGWRRPTRTGALIAAAVFGVAWTALSYAGGGNPMDRSWQRIPMVLAGPVLSFGEEIARAFIVQNLHRGGVPAWLQIIIGGVAMGGYHGLVGGHFTITYALSSFVMFSVLTAMYIYGRRSLTPVLIAHALPHVLGDPSLTQGILVGVKALGG